MNAIKAVFFDLSGVLHVDYQPIGNAKIIVNLLRERGLLLRFVTNTASKTSEQILKQLNIMGFQVAQQELFTAPQAAQQYILKNQLRPLVLVHSAIQDSFIDYRDNSPNAVLLGDARDDFTFEVLNEAFKLLKHGNQLIAIGKNKYFQTQSGLQLDGGAMVHALEWAADCQALVMGKPSPSFYAQVVSSTPYCAKQCLMVGDDVFGDIEGALHAGLQAALVKTGKYQIGDEHKITGDFSLIDSVADIITCLE